MARGQYSKHTNNCQAELMDLLRQEGGAASVTELYRRGAWGIRTATINALIRRGEIVCEGKDVWRDTLRIVGKQPAGLRAVALQILDRLNFDTSMPEVQADADDLVAIMCRNGLREAG